MANRHLEPVRRHIRKLAGSEAEHAESDQQLLERFRQRDGAAFESMLRRHGPMVMGMCRRVLGHTQDAEDAFQAAFLILVRKAGVVNQSLGSWLYTVAYRVALRARANTARRRECEREAMNRREPCSKADEKTSDVGALLDEELHRLPMKYRTPLVLCYLEGRTERETARELGLVLGTLSTQLANARAMLRNRLARRGVALSTGMLAHVLAESAAPAAVPGQVADLTLAVAQAMIESGAATTVGIASAPVAALAEEVLQTMLVNKLKKLAAALVAAALICGGLAAYRALAAEEPAAPATEKKTADGLSLAEFAKVHELIKPQPGESRWMEIPWLISLWEARQKAAAEGKPMFVWSGSGGAPCAPT